MITRHDVVIAGAGLGGSFLALLLGRAGLDVLLVEPGPTTPWRGAEVLKPRGIRVLAEHGLLPALLEAGATRREAIHYFHDGEWLQTLDFALHTQLGYYLVVPYGPMVGCISQACAQLDTLTVEFNTTVTAITRANGGHLVELSTGTVVQATAVIGADGPRSAALAYLGATRQRWTYEHVMRAGFLPTDRPDRTHRLYFQSDGSFAYLYPLTDTATRVFIGLPPEVDEKVFDQQAELLFAHLSSFVTHNPQELSRVDTVEFPVVPVESSLASRYVRDGVAVLGSAAFSCHPMTGQGMSYTLQDASVLAHAITEAARHHLPPTGLLLHRYSPRRAAHRQLITYGHGLATSYASASDYQRVFQPTRHGGDPADAAAHRASTARAERT